MTFTKEEILEIDKTMGRITTGWKYRFIQKVIELATKSGVKQLYWNSSETLNAGGINEGKKEYFYEKLPQEMGFKMTQVNLRGKGNERMWVLPLSQKKYASNNLITLEQIPKNLQGAVIGMLRSRGPYRINDLKNVLQIIKEGKKQKRTGDFSYDTSSQWNSGQQFTNKSEMIVKQKIDINMINDIIKSGSPAIKKFISYIIDPTQHFSSDSDVTGWALISTIKNDIWVINQIQTDTINKYRKIRDEILKDTQTRKNILDIDSITDRLNAANKSVWIDKLNDEEFLQKIQEDISIIQRLPTNDEVDRYGGTDKWLEDQGLQENAFAYAKRTLFKQSFNLKRNRLSKLCRRNLCGGEKMHGKTIENLTITKGGYL